MEERDYRYWFAALPDFSPLLARRLLSLYGSPEEIFRQENLPLSPAQQRHLRESRTAMPETLRKRDEAEKEGTRWIWFEESAYPARLRELADAPLGLFWRGKLPPDEVPSVGIVGARSCSVYGRSMAERFGGELGEQGIAVISGMARGIDGIAQMAALAKGGASYAVLGCGADICYPPSNRRLYEKLCGEGGILSEFAPGTPPLPHHFPLRNRLISALCDVLLVIEAREKSGSLITVDYALEQGREVLALPGRIDDPLSAGCNGLIRQGAGLLSCCGDIYEALGVSGRRGGKADKKAAMAPELKSVWDALRGDPKHVEELMDATGKEMGELSLLLLELESVGFIRQAAGGCWYRT